LKQTSLKVEFCSSKNHKLPILNIDNCFKKTLKLWKSFKNYLKVFCETQPKLVQFKNWLKNNVCDFDNFDNIAFMLLNTLILIKNYTNGKLFWKKKQNNLQLAELYFAYFKFLFALKIDRNYSIQKRHVKIKILFQYDYRTVYIKNGNRKHIWWQNMETITHILKHLWSCFWLLYTF